MASSSTSWVLSSRHQAQGLRGAVDFLSNHAATRGEKLGVVGFCMGGQLALFAAAKNPKIGACVDFYGIHPQVKPDFAGIRAPVLGLFAEKDAYVTPAAGAELESTLKAHRVKAEIHVYPGVDHGFFNDQRPVYNLVAATDAWGRVLTFFGQYLS